MSSGLGEDVVQIVADAEERESLVEEFPDAAGSEEEDAEDNAIFLGVGDQLVGRGQELRRGVHVREFVLDVEPHGHAQVVLAEEEHVDAG